MKMAPLDSELHYWMHDLIAAGVALCVTGGGLSGFGSSSWAQHHPIFLLSAV